MTLPITQLKPDEKFDAPSSVGETWDAGWDQGFQDTFIMSHLRQRQIKEFNQIGEVKTPEEIMEKHNIEVATPMTELAAFHITEQKEDRARREMILSKAPDTFLGSTAKFMSGMAGVMTDPVDFAAGAVLGAGISPILKAAKAGKGMKFVSAVLENVVATSATEIAAVKASKAEEGEYTAEQAMQNVVLGSLAMTSIIHGGSAAIKKIMGMGSNHISATFHTAEAAIHMNKETSKILDIQMKALTEDLKITKEIQESVDVVFGENAGKILDKEDDLGTMYSKIREGVKDGSIPKEQASELIETMQRSGVEERLLDYADENAMAKYSPETLKKIKDELANPKSDYGHSERADRLTEETPVNIEQSTLDADNTKVAETVYDDFKKTVDEGSANMKEILKSEKEIASARVEITAIEEIAKCFGVGA